jgi:hypothetical protein
MGSRTTRQSGFVVGLLAVVLLYVSSYVALSLCGRYEPLVFGADGPKGYGYGWVPAGFGGPAELYTIPSSIYFPLLCLDWKYWHRWSNSDQSSFL